MIRRSAIQRLILGAALIAATSYFFLHPDLVDSSSLERLLGRSGRLAPILFVMVYAVGTVLFLPGSILSIAGGALFGSVLGTICNLLGGTIGATIAFMIARYLAYDWVADQSGERLRRLMRGVEEEGWRSVAFVRLVPLFPFNLVNYAFGLTPITLSSYVATSFVCMAPGALAYTYVGYAGRQAASGQSGAIRAALFALALIAAVAFLARLVRRFRGPRSIEAQTLKNRLKAGERFALIDVRTAEEFAGPLGHILNATNIPVGELARSIPDLLKTTPLITI